MRTLQRVGTGLLALALGVGVAACGDDDDGDAPGGENAAFCDGVVAFNSAVFEIDISEESTEDDIKAVGADLEPLSQTLVDEAPDDLADAATTVHGFITPLLDGDAEDFNSDETFATYQAFVADATAACAFEQVDVEARDYAFDAPDNLDAGNVSFAFTNVSEGEDHEMVLLRKGDGVDLTWAELLDLPEEDAMTKTEFVGVAWAAPGESGSSLASLDAGDYAMVCFIPVGGEEDGPPHFTQGMIHEFSVG